MNDYTLMVQPENNLPEVTMENVDTLRAIDGSGNSVELPKENAQFAGTQISVSVAGVTATNVNTAIAELKANEDTLGSAKENVSNKKSVITDSETDYTSGKAVYDGLALKVGFSEKYVSNRNKYYISQLVDGIYINQANGNIESNAVYSGIEEFIPIDNFTNQISISFDYHYASGASDPVLRYALYDANYVFVSGALVDKALYVYDAVIGIRSIAIDVTGCKYIRVSVLKASIRNTSIPFNLQIEIGSVATTYVAGNGGWKDYVQDSFIEYSDITQRLNSVAFGGMKSASVASLPTSSILAIHGNSVRKNTVLSFYAKITTFNALYIGRNDTDYGYVMKVDATNIYFGRNLSSSFASGIAHGLTIGDYIAINIIVPTGTSASHSGERATINISSLGGTYQRKVVDWDGVKGDVFIKTGASTTLTKAKLNWSSWDYQKPIWMYGDSYFSHYATERWPYHLLSVFGFDNILLNGFPGAEADDAYADWLDSLDSGRPKYAAWCQGMNNADPDSATVNTTWQLYTDMFIADCLQNKIIPILATIPNVPTRVHVAKNAWIKASGYRYIDFAEAVGAELEGSTWLTGCLEVATTRIHPTTNGARLLCNRALVDLPELMNGSALQFGKIDNALLL